MNVQEWGCFSIFRRADDVTRTMSKEGVLVNVFTPPPLQEILYPRLYHIHAQIQFTCVEIGRVGPTQCVYIYTHKHAPIHTHACTHYMYIYIYTYIYIHTHIHTYQAQIQGGLGGTCPPPSTSQQIGLTNTRNEPNVTVPPPQCVCPP